MRIFPFVLLTTVPLFSYAQQADSTKISVDPPNIHLLKPATVTAYGLNRNLQEVPVSLAIIGEEQLQQYGNTNIVSAINSRPGVHMDERSPGSYRLNFRGSSLRSPFGVRNVKIYYNDIPITDPGGFTYLNQLGYYNFSKVQIIKGPGSSLYGAGNGGVMLINSFPDTWTRGAEVAYSAGSFQSNNFTAAIRLGDSSGKTKTIVRYQHQSSAGYRVHTASKRNLISLDAVLKSNAKNELNAHFLYNELFYETPGALTMAEYNADPKNSRPNVGSTPGAISSHAAVYQKNALAGLDYRHQFSTSFQNTTTFYVSYTDFKNPGIRNYGKSIEPHFGGRTSFSCVKNIGESFLDVKTGAELQQEYASFMTFKNIAGNPDTLQTHDAINTRQLFGFLQLNWRYKKWTVEGGASLNWINISLARLSSYPYTEYHKDFNSQLSPRIALMYRAGRYWVPYINIAKGFSPPTSAELSPSGSAINFALAPEEGWNYEAGIRGSLLNDKLHYDINIFNYQLSQAIVLRRDSLGGDYYINAGKTLQQGLEASIDYEFLSNIGIIYSCKFWLSYTGDRFRYTDFVQLKNDYSGSTMPGTPPNVVAAGIDLFLKYGLRLNVNYYYSDHTALEDANLNYAESYHLLGCKISYKKRFRKVGSELFAGIDNIFDQRYSLGNDVNAAGGRFFNAAPGINYFAGIKFDFSYW